MRSVIIPYYGFLNSGIKRLWNLKKFAKRRSLYASTQDEVGSNVIALDLEKRKLLYAKKTPDTSACLIIDLNNLEACSIKKEYEGIDVGALKTKKLHHFLKKVFLNLSFKNGSGIVSLPLFDSQKEKLDNIEQMQEKANKWVKIVSKLLPVSIIERA